MSQRETRISSSLQKWDGVDQRTQPTLVPTGFFVMASGIFFGLGENCERMPGKKLKMLLDAPVFGITQFGDNVFIQTTSSLRMVQVSDLRKISAYLTYVSGGDANGVCYFRGTNNGVAAWMNPHTSGVIVVVKSSVDGGVEADLVDRLPDDISTGNLVSSFIGVDLGGGNTLRVNAYSIRNRQSFTTESIRNWKLQGCNSVASNSVADWNAATWTDLDIQAANATITGLSQWGTFPITLTALGYRYLRILQTGANSTGSNYLCMGEFEFYGKFTY